MICCNIPLLPRNKILPDIYDVPLNDEEQIIWQSFKDIDYGTPSLCGLSKDSIQKNKRTIGLDHPFVKVVADFAIDAFNKSCQMFVKNAEYSNLHDCELLECNYLKRVDLTYYFYVTFEAIEEGVVGVYESKVVCRGVKNTKITLMRCVLTDRTPAGKKAMALSRLNQLGSLEKHVKDMKQSVEICLGKYKKGKVKTNLTDVYLFKKRARVYEDSAKMQKMKALTRLKKHKKILTRIENEIFFVSKLLSPGCTRMTNQDDWLAAEKDYCSGLRRRRIGLWSSSVTTCWGYDFFNPSAEFGNCLPW